MIINKEKEVFRGLWTRVQGQERPILDYVLKIVKSYQELYTEMIVDESNHYSAFKLEKK